MHAFVFNRKRFNRHIALFVGLWALSFITRVILYVLFGQDFFVSSGNRILGNFSGVFAGVAMALMVIKKKSAKVPTVESNGSHVK